MSTEKETAATDAAQDQEIQQIMGIDSPRRGQQPEPSAPKLSAAPPD